MATMFGVPGKEPGDIQVFNALSKLPPDVIVYAQPKLVFYEEIRYPDYVIVHRDRGVIVLEVKDWINIEDRDRKRALVKRQRNGKVEWHNSPVEQARTAAFILTNMLKEDQDLVNYAGKLDFPYRNAGILPYLPISTITWLEEAWGKNSILGRDNLLPDRIQKSIESIPAPFTCLMSERQIRSVCAILDDWNKAIDRSTGVFKGVYDREQEKIAKEPLKPAIQSEEHENQVEQSVFDKIVYPTKDARVAQIESELPDEVIRLKKAAYIRLLRGFAGTGKTDVLILRAFYLSDSYPDQDILVTTFNRPLLDERLQPELESIKDQVDVISFDSLCSDIYQMKHGQWVSPQDTLGLVTKLEEEDSLISEFGCEFVADEIVWLKESGLTERNAYVQAIRTGRGAESGRRLSPKMKGQIFDIYERYEDGLRELPAHDWVDLHEKTWKYLQNGIQPKKMYDAILIDEAQHFAPTWMNIISAFLKPKGSLFISDDPSQSVYRLFSWHQRGVDVVGRTRWLRIPYRNTRQIFEAAFRLIESNSLAQKMLSESGMDIQPDLDSVLLRDGNPPQVHKFSSFEAEKTFVHKQMQELSASGILPREICILHNKSHILDTYRRIFKQGIQIDQLRRQTGMEYKVVFIPRIQDLFERDIEVGWEQDLSRQQIMFYMAMTRARDSLYLLYGQKWPKQLDALRPSVKWHD